jgi:catechol 2,3-dioxygenase-like lactoylglutathione lyase family enzyme
MPVKNFIIGALLLAMGIISASIGPANVWAETMTPIAIKTRIDTDKFVETRAFYADVMGLEVLEEWDDGGDAGCIFGFSSVGSTGFLEIGKAEAPAVGLEALSLQFRVDDIEAVVKSLVGKWPFKGPVTRPWGSTYLYLVDPNGITIIIFEGNI